MEESFVLPEAFGLLVAFALVLLNGFFVAAEFSLVKVRQTRLTELAEAGSGTARQAGKMVGHLDYYLAATQLGITLASLGLGWIGEPVVAALLEPPLHDLFGLSEEAVLVISFAVGFGLITLLHITIGELAPKSIAILRPDGTALVVAWPLHIFAVVMRPVIAVLNGTANAMLRLVGLRAASESELAHSEEELRLLLASSGDQGVLDPVERELASRSLALGELSVRQVMVPRMHVAALDEALPLDAARAQALELRHAQLGVYRGSLDEIVGWIAWFDLFAARDDGWAAAVRPLSVVPESVSVSTALTLMRAHQAEIALVLDEYGGTAGLLFADDILDEVASHEIGTDPGVLAGSTQLRDLADLDGLAIEEDVEAATIGGYITEQLKGIPPVGARLAAGAWDLVVERSDGHRVEAVRLVRRPS